MDMILVYNQKEIKSTKLKLDKLIGDNVIIKSWQEKINLLLMQ